MGENRNFSDLGGKSKIFQNLGGIAKKSALSGGVGQNGRKRVKNEDFPKMFDRVGLAEVQVWGVKNVVDLGVGVPPKHTYDLLLL